MSSNVNSVGGRADDEGDSSHRQHCMKCLTGSDPWPGIYKYHFKKSHHSPLREELLPCTFYWGINWIPCEVHCSKLWLQGENNFNGWIHVNIPGLLLMVCSLGLGGKTRRLHEGSWGESKSSAGAEGQGRGGLHTWLWGQMCMGHYVCTKMEINKNSLFLRSPSFLQYMFETFQLWFLENNNLTWNLAHWMED